MKYYIIAGEASGDLHASNLMKSLKVEDAQTEFRFWGGDLMEQQGGTLVKHYKDLAFMGFLEVLLNIKTILSNIQFCKEDIKTYSPDVLILVDYPGFNLRIAKFAKSLGIKVVYYISPQLWAWKEGRVKIIKKYVDLLLVILPFEEVFYQKHQVKAHFVGHPLLDAIANLPHFSSIEFRNTFHLNEKPIIALLPGSREQEVKKMLQIMLSVQQDFPDYQFVIAGAPSLPPSFYTLFSNSEVKIIPNQTYNLLRCSKAALVTSGTATLETALLNVPQVVCYKSSYASYQIAKYLVRNINFISLVNLIMNREVVKELIQNELTTQNLKEELNAILTGDRRNKILKDYQELKEVLGGEGASSTAAKLIIQS